jgi:hypothetical protein
MFHPIWRLSEPGADNLGLACDEEGLVLSRTPLLERRDGRFVVRDVRDIRRLLGRAYRTQVDASLLMGGLATVAAALNANDLLLARIARCTCASLTYRIKLRAMHWSRKIVSANTRAADIPQKAGTGIRRCIRARVRRPIPAGSRRPRVPRLRIHPVLASRRMKSPMNGRTFRLDATLKRACCASAHDEHSA